jgi:hypothetical protein
MYTAATVKETISSGSNVHVGASYTGASLKEFARLAVSNDIHLTISTEGKYTGATIKELARIGKKNITIILK